MDAMRLIDIGIVVFSTLAVVCVILAAIRYTWLRHKGRTSVSDEERALRRWQNHRPAGWQDRESDKIASSDDFLP
jgi:hypothetical protein